jgi:hypothetical protein
MNIILGAIGANLTFGLISGITSNVDSVYKLMTTVLQSSSADINMLKDIIKDVEIEIKSIQLFLHEIKITEQTPYTILYCMECIRDAIKDVSNELKQINFRLRYNDNLWFNYIGSYVRTYKFDNCKTRLQTYVKNLESRHRMLLGILNVEKIMYKNELLETIMPQILVGTRLYVQQLSTEQQLVNSLTDRQIAYNDNYEQPPVQNISPYITDISDTN